MACELQLQSQILHAVVARCSKLSVLRLIESQETPCFFYEFSLSLAECVRSRYLCIGPFQLITESTDPDLLPGPGSAVGLGYGESKWVAEQILDSLLPSVSIVRLGQMAGGPNGAWNAKEWFPAIVLSAPHLKCLPDMPGSVRVYFSSSITGA